MRVDRHVALLGRELERQLGADVAVLEGDRAQRRDEADAVPALEHVVADHQVGAVGDVDLELAGGHERQAAVGVVGEEDRHQDDEHGHRADQDRVGEGGLLAAA